jgi:hypothetical protein
MSTYLEELKQAKTTVIITPASLIFEKPGQRFRGLYLGQRVFESADPATGEVKAKMAAYFFDGEKILFNLGAQLTRALSTLSEGVSVEIELKELKSNKKGGKTKIYDVSPLDLPIQNPADVFGGHFRIAAPAPEKLLHAGSANETTSASTAMTNAEADQWIEAKDREVKDEKLKRQHAGMWE